jgi:uncharacterized protein (DUF2267 family)
MGAGLPVFDTTLQETNTWLKALEARLKPCTRQQAYGALRAVLHVLRDRLPLEAVAGLSAQLPMLVRGLYFEGWRPADGLRRIDDPQEFAEVVQIRLPPAFPRQPNDVIEAVFAVVGEHLDPGETHKLVTHLPRSLRTFWPFEHQVA